MADIATLANGYLMPKSDTNGNGTIDLNSAEAQGPMTRSDGKQVESSILTMGKAADHMSNSDGKVTAQEFANLLSTFDVGGTGSVAGDGKLSGAELKSWQSSGLVPLTSG